MESDRRMILGVSPPGTEVAWYGSSKDVGFGRSENHPPVALLKFLRS